MTATVLGQSRKGNGAVRKNGQYIEVVDTYIYKVYTDTVSETRDNVRAASGLPIVGITTLANGAVCISKEAERNETNPLWWEVTCEFSSARDRKSTRLNSSHVSESRMPSSA